MRPRRVSGAGMQEALLQTALFRGWIGCHFRSVRTGGGYRTPVEGTIGFPDLAIARSGVVKPSNYDVALDLLKRPRP